MSILALKSSGTHGSTDPTLSPWMKLNEAQLQGIVIMFLWRGNTTARRGMTEVNGNTAGGAWRVVFFCIVHSAVKLAQRTVRRNEDWDLRWKPGGTCLRGVRR